MGTIDGASPGPMCGWTFSEAFGVFGGSISFTPGVMTLNTTNANDFPGATKPLPAPLVTVNGLSGQFEFTEYATPPNVNTTYELFVTNQDLSEGLTIALFGDGSVAVQVGLPAAAATYTGAWTPNNGSHDVHFSTDALGVPTLYIDQVAIPLTFIGNSFSFPSFLPTNVVSFFGGSADPTPASSPVRNIFLTAGALGPATEFCCP